MGIRRRWLVCRRGIVVICETCGGDGAALFPFHTARLCPECVQTRLEAMKADDDERGSGSAGRFSSVAGETLRPVQSGQLPPHPVTVDREAD